MSNSEPIQKLLYGYICTIIYIMSNSEPIQKLLYEYICTIIYIMLNRILGYAPLINTLLTTLINFSKYINRHNTLILTLLS